MFCPFSECCQGKYYYICAAPKATPHGNECVGSSHGWLVHVKPSGDLFCLFDPFLNDKTAPLLPNSHYILIPALESLPDWSRGSYPFKVVLSAYPSAKLRDSTDDSNPEEEQQTFVNVTLFMTRILLTFQ